MALLERLSPPKFKRLPSDPGLITRFANTVRAGMLLSIFGPMHVFCIHKSFVFFGNLLPEEIPQALGYIVLLALVFSISLSVSLVSLWMLAKHFSGEGSALVARGYFKRNFGFRYLSQDRSHAVCIDLGSDRRPCQISVQLPADVRGQFRFRPGDSQLLQTLKQEGSAGLWSQMMDEEILEKLSRACDRVEVKDGWLTLKSLGDWPGGSLEKTEALLIELATRAALKGDTRIEAIQEAALRSQPMSSIAIEALAKLGELDALEDCAFAAEAPLQTRMDALQAFALQADEERVLACVDEVLEEPSEAYLLQLLHPEQQPFILLLVIWGLGVISVGKAIGPLRWVLQEMDGAAASAALHALRMIQARVPDDLQGGALSFSEGDAGQLSVPMQGELSLASL